VAGALKIWDGTAWQTVSQAGPPGTAPVTSVDARTGAVTLSDLYVAKPGVTSVDGRTGAVSLSDRYISATDPLMVTSDWTTYTPIFATENNPSGSGMTFGSGGALYGAYRIVAPYTMAIRTWFLWGSSGGNGSSGSIIFGLPPGYSTSQFNGHQRVSTSVYRADNGYSYVGYAHCYANDVWMRPLAPNAANLQDVVGWQMPVHTDGQQHPAGWYPNGQLHMWGTLNIAQRS
jgi:hypothetical protein